MSDQIVLAWTVDVAGTSLGPAQAATRLGAVPLYTETEADPVLGQLFGLTVEDDDTTIAGSAVTRTLKLNMTAAGPVTVPAPPIFPCRPRPDNEIEPPYAFTTTKTLPGSFFVVNGLATVPTTLTQVPSLVGGDSIQFLAQQGTFYEVLTVTATTITLTAAYTGVSANTEAFKEVPAPVVLAAIFSTSPLDTAEVTAGTPSISLIPAGPGARTIDLTYTDSLGAGPFTVNVDLTGKRPAVVVLDGGSIDIAVVESMVVTSTGSFDNTVGQLTLVELSEPLAPFPAIPTTTDFKRLTDTAQITIARHLVYMPPSYFALAQQGASTPQLEGDFIVTTGQTHVPTTVDQSVGPALAAGNVIQFASQPAIYSPLGTVDVFYTIAAVGPKSVTLTTPYTGIEDGFTGQENLGVNSSRGTKGNVGSEVQKKATAARLVGAAAPPTDDQLSAPLGRFVNPGIAGPPPGPPLTPTTMVPAMTAPNFLSDLFTQTLQIALAGVPITPEPITFLP
jgi:hypothetical protein